MNNSTEFVRDVIGSDCWLSSIHQRNNLNKLICWKYLSNESRFYSVCFLKCNCILNLKKYFLNLHFSGIPMNIQSNDYPLGKSWGPWYAIVVQPYCFFRRLLSTSTMKIDFYIRDSSMAKCRLTFYHLSKSFYSRWVSWSHSKTSSVCWLYQTAVVGRRLNSWTDIWKTMASKWKYKR